jgi:hypothetical protein
MNFQKIVVPLAGLALLLMAHRAYGWPGLAAAGGGLVMWVLLHFTRMLQVLKRAAKRPVGYVDSAVMLHARLQRGASLLHVIAMTRALGELRSPKDTQPEVFRWTDAGQSYVDCEFAAGKVAKWELVRPAQEAAQEAVAPPP